jgi:hypothetical protein
VSHALGLYHRLITANLRSQISYRASFWLESLASFVAAVTTFLTLSLILQRFYQLLLRPASITLPVFGLGFVIRRLGCIAKGLLVEFEQEYEYARDRDFSWYGNDSRPLKRICDSIFLPGVEKLGLYLV